MPVKSKAQWGWLGANRPDLLHKWQKEAPRKMADLPKHVKAIKSFRRAVKKSWGKK